MTVLAFYSQPNEQDPRAVKLPDDKVKAVDAKLCKKEGISIGGTHYPDERIIGLFDDAEWQTLRETLLKPPPTSWNDMRKEDWYIKAKRGKK